MFPGYWQVFILFNDDHVCALALFMLLNLCHPYHFGYLDNPNTHAQIEIAFIIVNVYLQAILKINFDIIK